MSVSTVQAQSPSPAYRRYTTNNQLPTNLTKSVVQDASGRLWIGTDNGVVRFDGRAFATIRAPLRSPMVKDVYSTWDGRLLLTTDRGIHEVVRREDTLSVPLLLEGRRERTDSTVTYPKSVYQDEDGRLWIAESDAITRYEDGTLTRYIPTPKLSYWSDRFMRSFLFAEPSDGPLVATAQRGYVYVFSEEKDRFRQLELPDRPPDLHIDALIRNPTGPGLLLGTSHGLYVLEIDPTGRLRRWEQLNGLEAISSLSPGLNGEILIGTWENGLYRIPRLDAVPESYGELPFRVIQDVMVTEDRAIVLATDTGLGVIPHSFFRTVAPPTEMGNRFIRDLVPGPNGTLWVSRNVGVFSVDRSRKPFRARAHPATFSKQIWGLAPTGDGLWIGFQDGHLEYVEGTRRRPVPNLEADVRLVRSLLADGDGGVWMLKDGVEGLFHVDASMQVTHYGGDDSSLGDLFCLYRTPDDTLYAGGEGEDGYLYRYEEETGRFVNWSPPLPPDVSSTVRLQDLATGPRGRLWMASSDGLLTDHKGTVRRVGVLDPFDVASISGIAITETGLIWLGTNRGLFAYDLETESVRRFNRQTGLPSATISPRALHLDKGRLWVGTAQGLAYLREPELAFSRTPKPVFTHIRADRRSLRARPASPVQLQNNATLEVGYAAPVFVRDGTIYRHRIRGEGEGQWSPLTAGSPLVLPELSAGSYTLELKAQQPGFGWSRSARLQFRVHPPWYLQWWALLLQGLVVLGLIGLLGLLYWHRRAQRKAERALYRSRKQYESVVENVEEAIFQLDPAGRWIFLNPAWTDITGYAVADSLGRSYEAFVHPDDRATLVETIAPLLEGEEERDRCQVRFEEPDGHAHWVDVRAQLLREEDGQVAGLTGLLVDIHDRKQYEDELINAKERAEAARERAEEMNRLKTVFLANMGHELRTPLTSILGFARALREELPDKYQDLVRPIHTSGRRLKRTFASVLSLAQIEGDALEIECEPVNVSEVLADTLDVFQTHPDQEGVALEVEMPNEPVYAIVNPAAFDRVLSNIVSNALKFTHEGTVRVRIDRRSEHVVVRVTDTGIGISEAFLPNVFDEFKQESGGRTRDYEGSGLGLTIAKRLVDRMEGEISVESEKGQGTTVTVRFPVAQVPVSGETGR